MEKLDQNAIQQAVHILRREAVTLAVFLTKYGFKIAADDGCHRIGQIDQKIAACERQLDFVTAEQRQRMQNQIDIWKKAKNYI